MAKHQYSDKLDAEEQISMEEKIAARIYDDIDCDVFDEVANQMGKDILYMVLSKFRPDLLE